MFKGQVGFPIVFASKFLPTRVARKLFQILTATIYNIIGFTARNFVATNLDVFLHASLKKMIFHNRRKQICFVFALGVQRPTATFYEHSSSVGLN